MSPWPNGDPRAVVQRVLADGRFERTAQRPHAKSWFEQLIDQIQKLWNLITEPLNHLTGNSRVATVLGTVVLVAVVVLVTLVVVRFASGMRWRRTAAAAMPAASGFDADARTLFARALAAASAGRHREAAALLWGSALRALDEAGRVRFDVARTPGEWRRMVRDASFDALARDAVVALFGDRGVDAALVARMREAYDRVVAPA